MVRELVWLGNVALLFYFVLLSGTYLGLLVIAIVNALRHQRRLPYAYVETILASPRTPPVAVLVPAFNEEKNIVEAVRSLLLLRYPSVEVIVINDGSTDRTLELLREAFSLRPADITYHRVLEAKSPRMIFLSGTDPRLLVCDKPNGGKSDALNVGINLSRSPYFCAVDADAVLEPDALLRLIRPILEDSSVIASGGIVRVANGCRIERGRIAEVRLPKSALEILQVVEYLRGFLFGRAGWSAANSLLIISGAFGMFQKQTVLEAGGYRTSTVGEDMELVVRLHRLCLERKKPYRVIFVPDPVCWSEVPSKAASLRRQRKRWQKGLLEVVLLHRQILFRPRYGRIGLLSFPHHAFMELAGPAVELAALLLLPLAWFLHVLNYAFFLYFFSFGLLFGVLLSLGTVLIEEITFRRYSRIGDVVRLIGFAILENLGYRQLTQVWRLEGIWDYLRGHRRWESPQRVGFAAR